MNIAACRRCVARSWLLGRLAGHLDAARGRLEDALALPSEGLIDALGGAQRRTISEQFATVDCAAVLARAAAAGLGAICCCEDKYPALLRSAPSPPAVLYFSGRLERLLELLAQEPVAVVGARRASGYGLEVAASLGGGLARAGLTVVSGMALGIDSAAHGGALRAVGPTVAVLACGADSPYPPTKRNLYRRIRERGAVVSELPPGVRARRWTFLARNRVIAGLSAMTIVVEAGERSGALTTATYAGRIGRPVGAVPGPVTAPTAVGANGLLARGARVIRGPQDVLDALFGAGARNAPQPCRPPLDDELARLLRSVANGADTVAALARAGLDPVRGLAALSALELAGYLRREAGGRYAVIP